MASTILIIDEKLSKVKHYTFESQDQKLCPMCSKPRTATDSKLGTLPFKMFGMGQKDTIFGAARKFVGPFYFVTALDG